MAFPLIKIKSLGVLPEELFWGKNGSAGEYIRKLMFIFVISLS